MKKFLTILGLVAVCCIFATKTQAETVSISHTDHGKSVPLSASVHDKYERDNFEFGEYVNIVLYESKDKNWEITTFNTYLNEDQNFTTLVGAKVYLNRMTYQKQ